MTEQRGGITVQCPPLQDTERETENDGGRGEKEDEVYGDHDLQKLGIQEREKMSFVS